MSGKQGNASNPITFRQQENENKSPQSPLISVVIPVYNAESYIGKCLESVLNSSLKNIEVICVDDGSTDSSLNILHQYGNKDSRLRILTQKNLHAGIARNMGIKAAQGKYIHFLDADDWIDSAAYEKWYRLAERNKSDVCACLYNTVDRQSGEVLQINKNKKYNDKYSNTTNIKRDADYLISNAVIPWNKIYLRSFLLQNNIFFDDLICANDRSFYYTVIYKAERFTTVQEYWIYHVVNNENSLVGNTRLKNFDVHFRSFATIWSVIENADNDIKKMILSVCIGDSIHFYRKSIGTQYQKSIENQMYDFWHKKYIPLLGDSVYTKWWFRDYLMIILRDVPEELLSVIMTMFDECVERLNYLESKNIKNRSILDSRSYKIGRAVTFPGRVIRNMLSRHRPLE